MRINFYLNSFMSNMRTERVQLVVRTSEFMKLFISACMRVLNCVSENSYFQCTFIAHILCQPKIHNSPRVKTRVPGIFQNTKERRLLLRKTFTTCREVVFHVSEVDPPPPPEFRVGISRLNPDGSVMRIYFRRRMPVSLLLEQLRMQTQNGDCWLFLWIPT